MPKWIHDRAEHILAKNPSMPKGEAFALATQQAHAVGKSPKGYGTAEGRSEAKEKYDTPGDDKKTANPGGLESEKMAAQDLDKIRKAIGKADPGRLRRFSDKVEGHLQGQLKKLHEAPAAMKSKHLARAEHLQELQQHADAGKMLKDLKGPVTPRENPLPPRKKSFLDRFKSGLPRPSEHDPAIPVAVAGALGTAGGFSLGHYVGSRSAPAEKTKKASLHAFFEEAVKLGAISDEQAQAALDRYETLERNKPTLGQMANYGLLGAATGPVIGAIGNAIKGRDPSSTVGWLGHLAGARTKGLAPALRGIGSAAAVGALGAGAVPLIRSHMDREHEKGVLKNYLGERGVTMGVPPTGGKLSEPFEPVEKAAMPIFRRALKAANDVADLVEEHATEAAKDPLATEPPKSKEPGKEKDSGSSGITPARPFDAGGYTVDLVKGAFATSAYSANIGYPTAPQKSQIPPFRAPSLRGVLEKAGGQTTDQTREENEDETKEILKGAAGSPDLIEAVNRAYDRYYEEAGKKVAAGAPTRGGFLMSSEVPAFRAPALSSTIQKPSQNIVTKLGSMTTPAGALAKAKAVGAPKVTAPPGPSIAQVAKPVGFGTPKPGALKNSI